MARVIAVRVHRRRSGGFYFAPGTNLATGLSELWTTDGATCAKVWQDPTGGNRKIAALAHATTTGKLYIFCDDYDDGPWNDFGVDVYRLDPTTNAVAHFGGPYQFGENVDVDHPAVHAAEYAGALYVAHQGNTAPDGAYVTRLDPTTGAVALVAQATGTAALDQGAGNLQADFTGGMGVRGNTLYWTDGVGLWSGTGGSLGFVTYLGYPDPVFPDVDGMGACGSPVSSPLDGEWYFPGQWAGDEIGGIYGYGSNLGIRRMIRKSDNSIDFSPPTPDGGSFEARVACLTVLYGADDATPLRLYALDDGTPPGNMYVWSKDPGTGDWSAEIDLHGLVAGMRGSSCAMKSLKGEMYVLASNGLNESYLFKRTVAGAWSLFRDFAGYRPEQPGSFPTLCPVARVSGVVKCHQM